MSRHRAVRSASRPVAFGLDFTQAVAVSGAFWGLLWTAHLWASAFPRPWVYGPLMVAGAPIAVLALVVARRGLWVRLDGEGPSGLQPAALGCLREGRLSGRAADQLAGLPAPARIGAVPAVAAVRLRGGAGGWKAVEVLAAGPARPGQLDVVI